MKRMCAALWFLSLFFVVVTASAAADGKPDYVIRENFFVGMITDIFMNMSDYEGKTLRYEGFVLPISEEDFGEGPEKFAVVRIATCCGPDDVPIGFACIWNEIPPEDTWVRVTGVLRNRKLESGEEYPYLEVQELEKPAKRGKQKVAM